METLPLDSKRRAEPRSIDCEILQSEKTSIDARHKEILRVLMVMSHDTRGSLIAIAAGLNLLSRGSYGKMDEIAAAKVDDLYGRITKLVEVTDDFLGKALALGQGIETADVVMDLRRDIVHPVLEELASEMRDHDIRVNNGLEACPVERLPVKASRTCLRAVLRNLLRNAINYGGHGCLVDVGLEKQESCFRLNVYNSGKPVPEELRTKLFTEYGSFTSPGTEKKDGLGLGLYMMKEIIRRHGGEIWYEAKPDGSNFVFTLPQHK